MFHIPVGTNGRKITAALSAIAVAGVAAACGSSSSSSSSPAASNSAATSSTATSSTSGGSAAPSGEPIKFGYINALTGPYAVAGIPELDGIKLAVKDINAAGGVCKRPLELGATADDQGQPNLSVVGIRKLVDQNGISLIIGPTITPPGLADAPVAESLKAMEIELTAQRQPWTDKTYIFSAITPQDVEGQLVFNWMKNKLGPGSHKVGIIYAAVPYAQAGYTQLNQLAKSAGWTVSDADSFDPTALSFTSQASRLAAANPEGVMIWGAATPADAQLLKQIRAAGYKGPAVGDVAYSLPDIPADAGAAADTIVSLSQLNTITPTPATQKFLTSFESTYKAPATYLPGAAYDAVNVLGAAIQKAGCKTDSTSVAHAMIGLNHDGVNGTYMYTSSYKGGPPSASFKYISYKNGKPVFVSGPPTG